MKNTNNTRYASNILPYIPFFYVIWSDDLVSASEINVVKTAIANDETLDTNAKKALISWLNPNTPPTNTEIKSWKSTINHAQVKLIESDTYPLTSFSKRLLSYYYFDEQENEHLKTIEINLGIQPNHYNHLFDVEVVEEITSDYYDSLAIDAILKGEFAAGVSKFHETLKNPIFNWDIQRTKEDFRKKVLDQVIHLAQLKIGFFSVS